MALKPQDVVMLLAISLPEASDWTNRTLAAELFISVAEVSDGLNRLRSARLLRLDSKKPNKHAAEEFLISGVKYAFPAERGGPTRGVPTSYAAPPLSHLIVQPDTAPPVWPDAEGSARGYAFSPLYKTVPKAAAKNPRLYEMLALLDAIRDGRPREVSLAIQELKNRLPA